MSQSNIKAFEDAKAALIRRHPDITVEEFPQGDDLFVLKIHGSIYQKDGESMETKPISRTQYPSAVSQLGDKMMFLKQDRKAKK